MNTYDPAEHPRAKTGEFTNKHRDEPKSDGLAAVPPASTPITMIDGRVYWLTPGGKLHREDGPAIIQPDGTEMWFKNGLYHRDDGPAIIHPDGRQDWYQDGNRHRDDGPASIGPEGHEAWYRDNKFHRDDGPAIIHPERVEQWCQHDNLHRVDGPAVVRSNGTLEWWENGQRKTPEEEIALSAAWNARTPEKA